MTKQIAECERDAIGPLSYIARAEGREMTMQESTLGSGCFEDVDSFFRQVAGFRLERNGLPSCPVNPADAP